MRVDQSAPATENWDQVRRGLEECVVEMPRPPITGSGSPNLGCLEAVYDEPAWHAMSPRRENTDLPACHLGW